ncbi:MAG TPA: hypothetical protein VMU15_00760 [Anaeromyxobacter sp.]|nr:hypothetical protein [Anaeromyxobacter sp.]
MKTRAKEGRDSVILGHRLEVFVSADEVWGVTVDGREIETRVASAYAAWALGAAESYRQGRVVGLPQVHD